MNFNQERISAVPTNIITGFLGVGKTTAIKNLLKQKPDDERWAVLVNEFGEVGIDGGLLRGQFSEANGVFVREVPGGCMCCSGGLPMQIALAQLLRRAKPHRLLIEPTGLGHPKEVLEVLGADYYSDVLSLQKTVTLVDARQLSDTRYTQHEVFTQQIEIADIIVGNKSDLYDAEVKQALQDFVESHTNANSTLVLANNGNFGLSLLDGLSNTRALVSASKQQRGWIEPKNNNADLLPASGVLQLENIGEGFRSRGWLFSAEKVFDRAALFSWLSGTQIERAKGVFITNQGVFGYNLSDAVLTEVELDDCLESRFEIIYSAEETPLDTDPRHCLL